MARRIHPSLWFDGKAEAAVSFYVSTFPAADILDETRYDESAAAAFGLPAGSVMELTFRIGWQRFAAVSRPPMFVFTPAISFVVECETQEEVNDLWAALGDGGKADAVRLDHRPVRRVLADRAEHPR